MQPPKDIRVEIVPCTQSNLILIFSKVKENTRLHLYKGTKEEYICTGVNVSQSGKSFILTNSAGKDWNVPIDNSQPLRVVRYPDLELFISLPLVGGYSLKFVINSGVAFETADSMGDAALIKRT